MGLRKSKGARFRAKLKFWVRKNPYVFSGFVAQLLKIGKILYLQSKEQ